MQTEENSSKNSANYCSLKFFFGEMIPRSKKHSKKIPGDKRDSIILYYITPEINIGLPNMFIIILFEFYIILFHLFC